MQAHDSDNLKQLNAILPKEDVAAPTEEVIAFLKEYHPAEIADLIDKPSSE